MGKPQKSCKILINWMFGYLTIYIKTLSNEDWTHYSTNILHLTLLSSQFQNCDIIEHFLKAICDQIQTAFMLTALLPSPHQSITSSSYINNFLDLI